MKLFEFFSHNGDTPEDEQSSADIQKDLMAFILDDDDIYKEDLLPLLHKLKAKGATDEIKKSLLKVVNSAALKFYKKEEFNIDPNKMFPAKMRVAIVKELLTLHKQSSKEKNKKNED